MERTTCSITDSVALRPKHIRRIRENGVVVKYFKTLPSSRAELIDRIGDSEIAAFDLVTVIDPVVIDSCPKLQGLITTSTGYQNVDIEYAHKKDITVCNCPDVFTYSVAEYVFCLLTSLSRRVSRAADLVKMGIWTWDSYEGNELHGKKLGVIGAGKIGSAVTKIAQGIGMVPYVCTAHPSKERAKQLGIEDFVPLDTLLKKSDFITIHASPNETTRSLISEKEFAKMKNGVVIINTASNTIVDTDALYNALLDKKVGGAALDSIKIYPNDLKSIPVPVLGMLQMQNVIISPDMAWYTKEGKERLSEKALDTIVAFAKGHPINVVR